MMKLKKSMKNRSGVSPVIATILMVAITVVLAAVLYVMVMGFGGESSQAPTASISKNSSGNLQITISTPTEYKYLKFSVNNTDVKEFAANAQSVGPDGSVTFVDPGNDGKVASGDYFTFTGTGVLTLLWVNGDTTQVLYTYNF